MSTTSGIDPWWIGFAVTVAKDAPERHVLAEHSEFPVVLVEQAEEEPQNGNVRRVK